MMKPNTGDERHSGDTPTRGDGKMAEKPQMTAPMAKMDHKAAVAKMNPEHVHKMVEHAMTGKAGPEMKQMAQQAMQPSQMPTGGGPTQDSGASGEMNNSPKRNPFMGGSDPEEDEAPMSRSSMFGGSRSM